MRIGTDFECSMFRMDVGDFEFILRRISDHISPVCHVFSAVFFHYTQVSVYKILKIHSSIVKKNSKMFSKTFEITQVTCKIIRCWMEFGANVSNMKFMLDERENVE